jgi:hypothetical protein
MSTEAISESEFLREFTREVQNKNAAVFAGAGLSMGSGYVDWKGLLKDVIVDLGLDPDREHDLVTLAQYHCNKAKGNRGRLAQVILDHFGTTRAPTKNHHILASLPIRTYWTTNYDKLLEKALEAAKKVPDAKHTVSQLSATRPDRDVIVYKMHGDVEHSTDAVISKDDYERYERKMEPFIAALRGDLVAKTFLFLGFSFTDPNIDYILSRVRVQYEDSQRPHYCIQKKVTRNSGESKVDFEYRELKQHYFIGDLKRFGILTVLVVDYDGITALLGKVAAIYKRTSIFISGAAENYGTWAEADAKAFLFKLGHEFTAGNRVVSGFGIGVGSAVLNGVLTQLDSLGKSVTDERAVLRPFPQLDGGKGSKLRWTEYRRALIEYAGIAIFVFGNYRDPAGTVALSDGMREEFDICVTAGVIPIPVGATGFMAEVLWKQVSANLGKFVPSADARFKKDFAKLGDVTLNATQLVQLLRKLVARLQNN